MTRIGIAHFVLNCFVLLHYWRRSGLKIIAMIVERKIVAMIMERKIIVMTVEGKTDNIVR